MEPIRSILVDADVWPRFNWASFDQDKILSYGHHQYTVYWDADKVLVVARRDLRSHRVQALRLPRYTLTIQPTDGHRNTVLGISPRDGRLHLSWDHHNNPLRYTRTRRQFLTDPPARMSEEDFEPAQPLAPGAPQRVTYPRFLNDGDGRLYFVYRSGGSGNGRTVFSRYDSGTGTWSISVGRLFGSEGTYGPWGNSRSRNAYLHDILFDVNNRLHVTWVYREAGSSWASNHDLHYAYSDDCGVTWMNNDGTPIAHLRRGDPIVLGDPGIVVQKIPVYSWLMNQCAMALDADNQPHVATYRLPDTARPERLTHSPPRDVAARLRFFHYWRRADGSWHSSGPLTLPEGLRLRRPHLVIRGDTAVLYWASNQGFRCFVARASQGWGPWQLLEMTGPAFTANDACKHDRRLLRDKGILSFAADPRGAERGKGYAILDFDVQDFTTATLKATSR
ncbi:MAG: BNR repeat-containing protein [Planctomycetota bacterium]